MTMARREFRCNRCQAVLARIDQPNYFLRIEAADYLYNIKHGSITLYCACGGVRVISPPRKVERFGREPRAA
jgi:hypothetical protein